MMEELVSYLNYRLSLSFPSPHPFPKMKPVAQVIATLDVKINWCRLKFLLLRCSVVRINSDYRVLFQKAVARQFSPHTDKFSHGRWWQR